MKIPRIVWLATLCSIILHGLFILTARYRLSYDAYNHMFFADHYLHDWWNLWEPRWYTGFEVVSYPPLVHQLIALAGRLIGVDAAFGLLLWVVLAFYPLAIYGFSRIFLGRTAAGYAALGVAILPAMYETAHTFGQLPTLTSGLFALLGFAVLHAYLQHGKALDAALAIALFTTVMAAHHATLLFLPFGGLAVFLQQWLKMRTAKPGQILFRILFVAMCAAILGRGVIWPFWAWGSHQVMQTPIDHPSRHNFLLDWFAPLAFFLPVYGPLIPLLPFVFWKGWQRPTLAPWVAFIPLFVLGLGGTTPLPRLLFGAQWEWLTYDRFALWASWMLMPFFGISLVLLRRQAKHRPLAMGAIVAALSLGSVISGLLPTLLPTQPPQVDMQPLADYLAKDDRANWRYVTFGLGDQFASLSLLTNATTVDGSYHTARGLPMLRSSGIGQIDTAYWIPDGMTRLAPIITQLGNYGVRWGFLNRFDYIPLLKKNGWVYRTTLSNNVHVWENPNATLPPPVTPPPADPWKQFSWGVFPLLSLVLSGMLGLLRLTPHKGSVLLAGAQSALVSALPLALCLWYYQPLFLVSYERVYFTYTSALFFLADGLAVLTGLIWLINHFFGPVQAVKAARSPILWLLIALNSWISLSAAWSADARISAWIALQCWICLGLIAALRARPALWQPLAWGCGAALLTQGVIGIWQFHSQSTIFTTLPGLNWPGLLDASSTGASVIEVPNGLRWLRIYGTLPHPNLLGGLLFSLAALLCLFETAWIAPLIGLAACLLALTFSRSAWLGTLVFGLILTASCFWAPLQRKRLILIGLSAALGFAITLLPLRDLLLTRSTAGAAARTEAFSMKARGWLAEQGWRSFTTRPLTGTGMGLFIVSLSQQFGEGYLIEPVHNIPLLAASELGIVGPLLLLAITVAVGWQGWQTRKKPRALLLLALLAGLAAIGQFDHYLWTLAPGRTLIAAVFGLWLGQSKAIS